MHTQWTQTEWEIMQSKLEKLSLEELRLLARRVEITFTGGNESIHDREQMTAKEQFIFVLNEADKEDLLREYKAIIECPRKDVL